MEMGRNGDEDQEKALAELARLICGHLLSDSSVVDGGTHLEIDLGSADFEEKLCSILGLAIADMPRNHLMAILIGKARDDMRRRGQPVLTDSELPPGFSSN